jgi:hypothetical protein
MNFTPTVMGYYLELIRKGNLKETQLITMSKFQRISAVLTQIPETLTR